MTSSKNITPLQQAIIRLEDILNREWALRGNALEEFIKQVFDRNPHFDDMDFLRQEIMPSLYAIRKNAPEIIVRGSRQLVLSLGYSYVAKIRIKGETSSHYVSATVFTFEPYLVKTPQTLKESGFEVPEHHYLGLENENGRFRIGEIGCECVIAEDLTENGKYELREVEDKNLCQLKNATELRGQLARAMKLLYELYKGSNPTYVLKINHHATKEGPQQAFRHMFFIQINPNTNTGKIVLGDLDHVFLYRTP